jgi:TonB family protein
MRSFCFAKHYSCFRLLPLFSLLVLIVPFASAQSPAGSAPATTPDWETLRPEGEAFSVLMPKGSVFETSKEPYHKMELNTRTYISQSPGAVFGIVSLSGIKSNPALYTEMQRVNSYVDAFKDIFAPKVRKGTVAKLTLIGAKTLQGNAGREYRMVLGDLNGIAQVYATRKRFYAVVHLSTKKEDEIQEQFLSSFVLPENIGTNPAEVASAPATPNATARTDAPAAEAPIVKPAANDADTKPDEPAAENPTKAKGPISGGVLNGKAISLPAPEYPVIAKQNKVSGVVTVQVTVDENGYVIAAFAASGHPLLQAAAIAAARQAKFSPTLLMGEPTKVTGVIVYNFGEPSN